MTERAENPKREKITIPMKVAIQDVCKKAAKGRGLKSMTALLHMLLFEEAKRQEIEWPEEE